MSFVGIMSLFQFNLNSFYIIEFFVKSLKDGLKCGFDPSLRIFFNQELVTLSSIIACIESWAKFLK